jgi:GTP-binding protein
LLDTKHIHIKAGKGGNGAVSFLHERFRPRGGPDGGEGGWGGSVYVVARKGMSTLGHLHRINRIVAEDGRNGGGRDRTGRKGKDRLIEVPLGTVVWREHSAGDRELVADLVKPNVKIPLARGGSPGRGNHRFASPTNQEPLLAEAGEEGEEFLAFLEVKVLGDVGLVGAPNAGKSTLLSIVSRAKPKIADYPFTTLEPVLGVVYHKGREIVVVDVPGLIEGASEGRGLGREFLRHVERVKVLVHLVDGSVENVGEEYSRVAKELDAYPGLREKPVVPVLSKIDVPGVKEALGEKLKALAEASGDEPLAISSATTEGIDALLDRVLPLVPEPVEDEEALGHEDEEIEVVKPRRQNPRIHRQGEVFVIEHEPLERIAPMVNFNNWKARLQFHGELERLGVIDALEKAGVESGDTVRIAGIDLEWD